jgi:CHAT domain-containing protein
VGGGEGVFGLQRAFHLAGVRTTLASLWQVDDRATRVLMTEFYSNLWKRKLSRTEALRQAQLTVLKRFDPKTGQLGEANLATPSNPYYWAAFSISGDWR